MSEELKIKDTFDKSRPPLRDLNTIIKVFDDSPGNIWVEFEEFVLTEALFKYLYEFCNDFTASLHFDSPKKPFWLEGFYGSGKTHFCKIIGLLFQNSEIITNKEKIPAINFFLNRILKNTQFKDEELIKKRDILKSSLELFPKQFNCKTIFINLAKYSKSESSGEKYLESFWLALLKEFNAFLGLSQMIETAELEKNLIKDQKFEQFKEEVLKSKNLTWEELRKAGPRARRAFLEIYPKITNCSEIIAQEYLRGAELDIKQKNIEDILEEINDFAEKQLSISIKGIEGKILIVLDEAGIFFSVSEARIGELLAAAEWINNPVKKSRINMIFSAQRKIEKYLELANVKIDFHQAAQRFKHWLLDKKNIKTIVVQRWLKKDINTQGNQLKEFIDKQYPKIIDGVVFNTINDPNLEYIKPSREDVFETYPFLPYQFPLMIQISQKLITEKIVEEEYGGKTRSILVMTRDVLDWPSPFSKKSHFIEDNIGTFVNLSQIYESILSTLRSKEEEKITLIDKTDLIPEDPEIFTSDELKIPIKFKDVARSIYLLKFIDEVYCNDGNIINSLFSSTSWSKGVFEEKVKKIIDILKKKGYISYDIRTITDQKGNVQQISDYKITSRAELTVIEESFNVHVVEDNIYDRLYDFFKNSLGKDLIDFRDNMNFPSLFGKTGKEYNLKNAIKIKLNWYMDPDFDEILGKLDSDTNIASIYVLTPRILNKYKDEIQKIQNKIIILEKTAFKKNQNLIFITPSLSQALENLSSKHELLNEKLKDSIRFKEIIKKPTTPPNMIPSFNQIIQDIDKVISEVLKKEFEEGFIFYGDGNVTKIGKEKINPKISTLLKETYSKVNRYAYLGQTNITNNDITTILTWDPKKQIKISPFLRKSEKEDLEHIPLFNENGTDLQPNLCEQCNMINIEFKKIIGQGIEIVLGDNLLEIFTNPPYSWKESTILGSIAALIRNNDWDVLKGPLIKNSNDKEIIEAFTESKKNYEKFRNLNFKIAERLTPEQLKTAATVLDELFNERITTPGPDSIDPAINTNLNNFVILLNESKNAILNLRFNENCLKQLEMGLYTTKNVLNCDRRNERIKKFIELFENYGKKGIKHQEFNELKKFLYRLQELQSNGQINRYYYIQEFLNQIVSEWLKLEPAFPDFDELNSSKTGILDDLKSPTAIYEDEWNKIWSKNLKLWERYWTSYINLHQKLGLDIDDAIKKIEHHENFKNIEKKKMDELKKIFKCHEKLTIPKEILSNKFTCAKCNDSYSILKNWESKIKEKINEINQKLEIEEVKPPPISPPKENFDIWNEYKIQHEKIEHILQNIQSQKSLFKENREKLKVIDAALKEFSQNYSQFLVKHKCSEKPMGWELEKLVCLSCKESYEDLIDIHSFIQSKHEDILTKLAEEEIVFPYETEIILDPSDKKNLNEIMQEKNQFLNAFVSNYYKSPNAAKKLKIKIIIEKVD